MFRIKYISILIVFAAVFKILAIAPVADARPLRVHPSNPLYFTDGSGKAIYLTGSHRGWELQDNAWNSPFIFDYGAFLDFLTRYKLNLIRMWVVESTTWDVPSQVLTTPMPYQRTGPESALDGELKFDLKQFNQGYFERLRSRVVAARDRQIYVIVMLFQGWTNGSKKRLKGNPWLGHPFNINNNVNGISGDVDGNGKGEEVHTLEIPSITRLQEAYVRKVIDTLNDLDNLLYEICNECDSESTDWQYHMINYIKSYEAGKLRQHPVGMTVEFPKGSNAELFYSPADWISPNATGGYLKNPPVADGTKVVIADSDHIRPFTQDPRYVWKHFLRGNHPLVLENTKASGSDMAAIRQAMKHTSTYAERMNLAAMTPRNDLASTQYCLANSEEEYLVYLPHRPRWIESISFLKSLLNGWLNGKVTVDLSAAAGTLRVEWFNPTTGETVPAGTTTGGSDRSFTAPFSGDAVLYLFASGASRPSPNALTPSSEPGT